ncbi:insulinase family protein [Oleiphilus messinensis]|nr:insulinase family protein [Oleiphilus messinensis]
MFLVQAQAALSETLEKSPYDTRKYSVLTLANELQVLVVSDPTTDKAAAALDIRVGSGNDPKGREGLAHFLEHMLFLGTEKYPNASEYQEFINQHGGSHNAFTAFQDTNYFFEVDANFLTPALDRFAQQFIAPTFTEKYVEREINAVHSEYSSKIQDDYRRTLSAFKTLINPDHSYSQFSVGNLTTLGNRDGSLIRDELIKFYEANYSANLMRLVILGKEDIATLEKIAIEKFSAIPNRNLKAKEHTQELFSGSALPKLIQVEPVMEKRVMEMNFPAPSTQQLYLRKPTHFINNLIGHEGKGSLLSELKSRGWVETLSAGSAMDTGHESLLSIKLSLTEKGLQNWKEIARLTFSYIDLVKQQGMQSFYFDEQKQMLDLAFKFAEKSHPIHFVSYAASVMHQVRSQHILRAGYIMQAFDPELYQTFLAQMTPENVIITLTAAGLNSESESEQVLQTEWYDAPYRIQSINPESIRPHDQPEQWFALPEPNEFIPHNVELLSNGKSILPTRLLNQNGLVAWYAEDTEFNTPKSSFFVNVRTPIANTSPKNNVMTSLFTALINDALNELTYPATLAGLQFSLYPHIRGMTIKISGYPQRQANLLTKILSALQYTHLSAARFEIKKDEIRRALENSTKQKPYEQTSGQIRDLLVAPGWTDEERLASLGKISWSDMTEFRAKLLEKLDLVTLAHGNITRTQTLALNALVDSFLAKPAQFVPVPRGTVLKLNPQDRFSKALAIDHPDSSYTLYLQGREKSYREMAAYSLAAQLLSTGYYEQMRTEKQFGYIVFSAPIPLLEVPGIAFIIQSPKASPEILHTETLAYLSKQVDALTAMPDEQFERHKQALISRIKEKETTLQQRSNRFWSEIDRNNEGFNTQDQLVSAIQGLDKPAMLELLGKQLGEQQQALLIFNRGTNTSAQTDSQSDAEQQTKTEQQIKAAPNIEAVFNLYKSVETKAALWEGRGHFE